MDIHVSFDKENTPLRNTLPGSKLEKPLSPSKVSESAKKAPSIRRILGDLPTPTSGNVKRARSLETSTSCQNENQTPIKLKNRKSLGQKLLKSTNSPRKNSSENKFNFVVRADDDSQVNTKSEINERDSKLENACHIDRKEYYIPPFIPPRLYHKVEQDKECVLTRKDLLDQLKQEDVEITEFIEDMLLECLETVKIENSKSELEIHAATYLDSVPEVQIIPPTPLDDNPEDILDAIIEEITSVNFDQTKSDQKQSCEMGTEAVSLDDSDKENLRPGSKINSFSSLFVECDDTDDVISDGELELDNADYYSPSKENISFSVYNPDENLSVCYKKFQNSGSKRRVLGSLPLLNELGQECNYEDYSGDVSVFKGDEEILENHHLSAPVETTDMSCSPMKTEAFYNTQATNTYCKTYMDISILTDSKLTSEVAVSTDDVIFSSVGLSPIKDQMVDSNTMTDCEPMLDQSMITDQVEMLDRSMLAQCSYLDKSMVTESLNARDAETNMTPFKLMNKRGKRLTAEEVRKQHPRTLANKIDTLTVTNEKQEADIKQLVKENSRLKTIIKDIKSELKAKCKNIEEFDSILSQERKSAQKLQDDKLESLTKVIKEQEIRLEHHQRAQDELEKKIKEFDDCRLQLEQDVINGELEYKRKLAEQSNKHSEQINEVQSHVVRYKEQYAVAEHILKEQEEQIQLLTSVHSEASKLMDNQNLLMADFSHVRTMLKRAIDKNISTQQYLQLQWNDLKLKKSEVYGEVSGYKMNNKLLLEEITDLRHNLTEKCQLLEEAELKFLSIERDLETALIEYHALQQELDACNKSMKDSEGDLRLAYEEVVTLRSTLKQTEDTLHHEQIRYASLQEEFSTEKEDLSNQLKLSENLVLNLQRTVDFRERDIERLENKLLEHSLTISEQKEQVDTLESQLFQCQEELQQKMEDNERLEVLQRNYEEREGVVEICLQSAREADDKNRELIARIATLQTVNKDNEEKHSQLATSFSQLQQDYLVSRKSLKESNDRCKSIVARKDKELEQVKEFLVHLDFKISSYNSKLENKISHECSRQRQKVKEAISNLYSSQEKLNYPATDADTSLLGPNAKPHIRVSSPATKSSVQTDNSSPLNTSVYNHVTRQSSTPAKSFYISDATQRSCQKLKELVEQRRKQHTTSHNTANKTVRHLEYTDAATGAVNGSNEQTNATDSLMEMNNSVLAQELDSTPTVYNLTDLCMKVHRRFEEVGKLVSNLEQNSTKSVQILASEKEDLESIKSRLEKQLQVLKAELAIRSEAVIEANEDRNRLKSRLDELNERVDRYSDENSKLKNYERENQKLLIDAQNKKDEIKLLTEELDMFFSRSHNLASNDTDDRRELLNLKRKNQELRMKIIESYNSIDLARNKIKKLDENNLKLEAEISRLNELVDTVKETLVATEILEQVPSLQQLMNIINGSDVGASSKGFFSSFHDSFMF